MVSEDLRWAQTLLKRTVRKLMLWAQIVSTNCLCNNLTFVSKSLTYIPPTLGELKKKNKSEYIFKILFILKVIHMHIVSMHHMYESLLTKHYLIPHYPYLFSVNEGKMI